MRGAQFMTHLDRGLCQVRGRHKLLDAVSRTVCGVLKRRDKVQLAKPVESLYTPLAGDGTPRLANTRHVAVSPSLHRSLTEHTAQSVLFAVHYVDGCSTAMAPS